MGRPWRAGLIAACTGSILACGKLSGLEDLERDDGCPTCDGGGGGLDASNDASSETSPVVLPTPMDPLDAATCPSVSAGPEQAFAYASKKAKKLDGDFSDWECATPLSLDVTNAGTKNVPSTFPNSLQVLIEWDPDAIYVAAVVKDPLVRGAATTNIWRNDAVEIFLSGATPRTGDYGPLDHQYIIDHAGRSVDTQLPKTPVPDPAGLTSATKLVSGGFAVEARIAASNLGKTLAAGTVLGFDLQLDDGDGMTSPQPRIVWAYAAYPSCACAACCCNKSLDQPSCNTLRFGIVTLK